MSGVSVKKYLLNDKRQDILEIYVKDFPHKKHYKYVKDDEIIRCLDQPLPIDSFFICFSGGNFKIYTTYTSNLDVLNIKLSYIFFFYLCLCLRSELTKIYFAQDMSLINDSYNNTIHLNMSCYYSGSSIAIHTTTAKNSVLSSISPIYSSFI